MANAMIPEEANRQASGQPEPDDTHDLEERVRFLEDTADYLMQLERSTTGLEEEIRKLHERLDALEARLQSQISLGTAPTQTSALRQRLGGRTVQARARLSLDGGPGHEP